MHILEKIVRHKKQEIAAKMATTPVSILENQIEKARSVLSISKFLKNQSTPGIIAEFKRRSPSKPSINLSADPTHIVPAYVEAGATAISILTDEHFFGGNAQDVKKSRNLCPIPILRKDFVIDEYQILEARAMGADVVLLIAEILSKSEVKELSTFARSLGLEILLEIHSEKQLEKYNSNINLLGVNNRNLDTFQVDFRNSIDLYEKLPSEAQKISESGIHDISTIQLLQSVGYDGFLIGERFMATTDPGYACHTFIQALNSSS